MLAAILCAVAWLPSYADASTIYADLDRDGVRDEVTVQAVPKNGLRVWLSGSGSSFLLATRRPVLGVTVSDLDGDGHLELVAADTSARLHVWTSKNRGKLRPTRPRSRTRPSGLSSSSSDVGSAPRPPSGAVIVGGFTPPSADDAHPARPSTPNGASADDARARALISAFGQDPPAPRGPPLS